MEDWKTRTLKNDETLNSNKSTNEKIIKMRILHEYYVMTVNEY